MKIQIDTTQKIIKLESSENLGELIDILGQMLPDDLWKQFKLETNTTITWTNPIIWRDIWVQPYIPYTPIRPYIPVQPWITWCESTGTTSSSQLQLNSGIYNVEC